jgi:NADPH-dependent 2,4-dienoyl-CoA reductase/sulfur reductase-like enzyme/peroxiredoxin family protein/rhodanese-related sulfurtransferase/TusA-related sulfurtransferase
MNSMRKQEEYVRVIIVGGNAGGASAAARLRRLDEQAEIVVYEKGDYISFANCGLPYHIGNAIVDRNQLLVQTPTSMKERFNIDFMTGREVTSIDRQAHTVTVKELVTGTETTDRYDKLVLSPGGSPLRPPIPGIDSEGIYSLWTIPDMDRIIQAVHAGAKKAVVVGGGFIGVEVAENLREQKVDVTLVEMLPQVLAFLDPDIAAYAHQELHIHGVDLRLGDGVKSFAKNGDRTLTVTLTSGAQLAADVVILAIGVRPNTHIAEHAGLTIGTSHGVLVDEHLRTSDPDIYAIGDVIEVEHFVTKSRALIPLAGPANRQARIAANSIVGRDDVYGGTQGTSIVKVFDLAAGATGASSSLLMKLGIPFRSVTIHPGSHAGYYPGSTPVHLKLLYGPEGRLLGAQAAGYDGVDKRIDVLATAIRLGATVDDLTDLELAYAPPYGSAKDPVNMAGFVAQNDLESLAPVVTPDHLTDELTKGAILLDVREPEETSCGIIPDAVTIPLSTLRDRIGELPAGKKVILTYCKVGLRGYVAQRILAQNGFQVANLTGGYASWEASVTHGIEEQPSRPEREADDQQTCTSGPCGTKTELLTPSTAASTKTVEIDACGLQCPGPLLKLKEALAVTGPGDMIKVTASDPGFYADVAAFAQAQGLEVVDRQRGKLVTATLRKPVQAVTAPGVAVVSGKADDHATIIVFSNDLDKVIAAFIIANGAQAMGKKISMFFTFWGLNVLRKDENVRIKKTLIERMFGMMMPRGATHLILGKMHMMGMGTGMILGLMKKYNVTPVEAMMRSILDGGGTFIACTMSMNLMGIRREELIDGIEEGGVATMLGDADQGHINFFI